VQKVFTLKPLKTWNSSTNYTTWAKKTVCHFSTAGFNFIPYKRNGLFGSYT